MSSKRGDSSNQVELQVVAAEADQEQQMEVPLMVAMQPGSVEVPAVGVEEVVIVTENTEATTDVAEAQVENVPNASELIGVGALEEVTFKSEDYRDVVAATKVEFVEQSKRERKTNREVAEFLAATGSGRPVFLAPRKQIKLEPGIVDTDSDSQEEETTDSDEGDEYEDHRLRKTPKKREFAHR